MAKTKELLEIPPVLTPELIKAIAENADALQAVKSILGSGDEALALKMVMAVVAEVVTTMIVAAPNSLNLKLSLPQ